MTKQVKLIISIIVCVALFIGAGVLYNNLKDKPQDDNKAQSSQTTVENEQAQGNSQQTTKAEATTNPQIKIEDITFYDENKNPVKLSDFRGKKVILNLWATWCGWCVKEMPDFQKTYEANGDDIQFIMLNVENTGEKSIQQAKSFIDEKGFTFPIYYDLDMQSNAYLKYTRGGIPATFFIDEEGNLVAMQPGAMNEEMLKKGISMLTEE